MTTFLTNLKGALENVLCWRQDRLGQGQYTLLMQNRSGCSKLVCFSCESDDVRVGVDNKLRREVTCVIESIMTT